MISLNHTGDKYWATQSRRAQRKVNGNNGIIRSLIRAKSLYGDKVKRVFGLIVEAVFIKSDSG